MFHDENRLIHRMQTDMMLSKFTKRLCPHFTSISWRYSVASATHIHVTHFFVCCLLFTTAASEKTLLGELRSENSNLRGRLEVQCTYCR